MRVILVVAGLVLGDDSVAVHEGDPAETYGLMGVGVCSIGATMLLVLVRGGLLLDDGVVGGLLGQCGVLAASFVKAGNNTYAIAGCAAAGRGPQPLAGVEGGFLGTCVPLLRLDLHVGDGQQTVLERGGGDRVWSLSGFSGTRVFGGGNWRQNTLDPTAQVCGTAAQILLRAADVGMKVTG